MSCEDRSQRGASPKRALTAARKLQREPSLLQPPETLLLCSWGAARHEPAGREGSAGWVKSVSSLHQWRDARHTLGWGFPHGSCGYPTLVLPNSAGKHPTSVLLYVSLVRGSSGSPSTAQHHWTP